MKLAEKTFQERFAKYDYISKFGAVVFPVFFFPFGKDAEECKSCRSSEMLKNESTLAISGVDTAENGLSEIWEYGPLRNAYSKSKFL